MFDRRLFLFASASVIATSGCRANVTRAKPRPDLYNCEGCEGALERNSASLGWQARIGAATEPGEPMRIEGRVLQADGTTPAPGVVIYAYHTNAEGLYANGTPETEWSRRHGRLRGWVKTDKDGRYAFDTIKPASYPRQTMPAHVHLTVIEPGRRAYYIDDIVFDGEFGVTPAYRAKQEFRGGGGIVRLKRDAGGRWLARRDIILERHP